MISGMNMCRTIITGMLLWVLFGSVQAQQVFEMASFGIVPGGKKLASKMAVALQKVREAAGQDSVVIRFQSGRYDFQEEDATSRMYYILFVMV